MVTALALWTALLVGQAPAPADANGQAAYREALSEGGYDWYDGEKDALAPVQPPWRARWLERIGEWIDSWSFNLPKGAGGGSLPLGQILFMLVALLLIVLVGVALYYAYRAYMPPAQAGRVEARVGSAKVHEGLPAGLQVDLTDPLGEARKLRAAGDYAGAILCLFVHQLVTLDGRQLLRLAPGKTARQLVRSISDGWFRDRVLPTMRLFESSYYGHRPPSESAFEHAWSEAERMEARLAERGRA